MREDDTLGIERDEPRRCSRSFEAVQLQQTPDIDGRFSIRRQNPERRRHDTRQRRQLLRFEIEDEIGEEKRTTCSVKEVDFLEDGTADQNLIDLAGPNLWRILAELRIDLNACFANLRSVLQARDGPRLHRGAGALPVVKEHPVSDTRRNQVAYRAERFDGAFQIISVLRWRVQQ